MLILYSAKQNTPQLAAWVPCIRQNLFRRKKFRNAPSACGGNRNFQGFASLLEFIEDCKSQDIFYGDDSALV